MTLSPQWLDELRARTTLSAVIAPTVKLTRAGREFKACCPFHQEKTPSFTINDEKGFYHCFGCGAHGDAIRFLTEHRGLPFMDAVKELASKAGLDVPAPDPKERERAEVRSTLTDVMGEVQRWYVEQLAGNRGEQARAYLAKRGISPDVAARFGVGLAPDGRGNLKAALAGKLGEDRLVETGMLIKPDDGGATYDRFRGRVMIPIRDARGRVIGFGGRTLDPDGVPKYLNSPDTPLFDKGRTLYNLDLASPASRKANRLIVVEGYMDVIGLARAGIDEVVAPNGTALTESQLERLWRLDPAPILCFDGDSAGQKAAIRAALRALPHITPERTLRFVELPTGQDPDDVVTSGGKEAAEALFENPEPLDARLWRAEYAAAQPLATPESKAALRQRLIDHSQSIAAPTLGRLYREAWLDRFAQHVNPPRQFVARAGPRGSWKQGKWTPPIPPVGSQARSIARTGVDGNTAKALILGFTYFPEELAGHCEALAALDLGDGATARVRDQLVDAAFSGIALDREALGTILGEERAVGAIPRALGFSFTRRDSDPARARHDLAAAVEIVVAAAEVDEALAKATERLKQDLTEVTLAEQQRLVEARQGLNERLASLAGTD